MIEDKNSEVNHQDKTPDISGNENNQEKSPIVDPKESNVTSIQNPIQEHKIQKQAEFREINDIDQNEVQEEEEISVNDQHKTIEEDKNSLNITQQHKRKKDTKVPESKKMKFEGAPVQGLLMQEKSTKNVFPKLKRHLGFSNQEKIAFTTMAEIEESYEKAEKTA